MWAGLHFLSNTAVREARDNKQKSNKGKRKQIAFIAHFESPAV
jgi:hypothetical protein